VTQKQNS